MAYDLNHALAVAREVGTGDAKIVAIVHDAVEGGDTTFDVIERCLGEGVAYAVDLLTRKPHEEYAEYILRIAVATGYWARVAQRVKIADVNVNLARCDAAHESLRPRWQKALAVLTRYRDLGSGPVAADAASSSEESGPVLRLNPDAMPLEERARLRREGYGSFVEGEL